MSEDTKEAPISYTGKEPFLLFDEWLKEAWDKEPNDANAMSLSTADANGFPDSRMVLLKGHDARGFTFFTNIESQKGEELAENMQAALLFHWKSLRRQVRIRGAVEKVTDQEADEYFASRAKQSQIGAWASKQSRPIKGRFELEGQVAKYAAKYALSAVPRPEYWSGFRVLPSYMEFWQDAAFRLHDRLVFTCDPEESKTGERNWSINCLNP
jgi:pyridoxamine 5'-phosphate oxidase